MTATECSVPQSSDRNGQAPNASRDTGLLVACSQSFDGWKARCKHQSQQRGVPWQGRWECKRSASIPFLPTRAAPRPAGPPHCTQSRRGGRDLGPACSRQRASPGRPRGQQGWQGKVAWRKVHQRAEPAITSHQWRTTSDFDRKPPARTFPP